MDTISVIVPCYNVVNYLERCVRSIVSQTYSDLEIILVDDGSTDNTGILCDRLAETDARIRVIHKQNGGLSDARNAGIDVAHGDFYSFVDGDDYLELDAYEAMIVEMQNPRVSLVAAGIIGVDIDGNKSMLMSEERLILSKEEAFINLLGRHRTIGQSSCNKLFRKNLFKNLRYKKGIINEDMEILPRILDNCDQVILLNKPVYWYVKRAESITELEFSLWKFQGAEIAYGTLALCEKNYPSLVSFANYYVMDSLFKMYNEVLSSKNRREFRKQEYELRLKILKEYFHCIRWKNIRNECGNQIKSMAIKAFFGLELTGKLVNIKQRIMGKDRE